MLVVDGLNGLWGLRLLNHTDRFALLAPQVMGLVVAAIVDCGFLAALLLNERVRASARQDSLLLSFFPRPAA
jgi:hypothetical protein